MALTLKEMLQHTVERGASDLHLTTNSAPQIRIDGVLEPLNEDSLTPTDTKRLVYSILTDKQKQKLEENLDIKVISKRSEPRIGTENLIPYGVEVVSIDHPGIVYEVTNFFSRRGINVEDLYTSRYPAPHTGASMFALHMTIGIPADSAIASVRGDFMDFCDDLNLDAMMAPVK